MTIPAAQPPEQNSAYGSTSSGPPDRSGGPPGFRTLQGYTMLARLLGCTALAALAGAPASHAPLTAKYRVDQTLTQEIDATPAGQTKQSLTFSTSSFVTLTFADPAGCVVPATVGGATATVSADQTCSIPGGTLTVKAGGTFTTSDGVTLSAAFTHVLSGGGTTCTQQNTVVFGH